MPEISGFKIGAHELTLQVSPNEAFVPTQTTQKIAEAVQIPQGGTVLDLGCGVGPLSIYAALSGAKHVYAVDIVPEAVELARENVRRAGVQDKVTVFCGDLFAPVKGMKFDVIVNDVSGIAERAARVSPWYPPNIPTGGADGTEVVTRVLSEAPSYLKPGGVLYFATSTLSDVPKILRHAAATFGDSVTRLGSYRYPFCPELVNAVEELKRLRAEGKIDYEEKRSRYLWTLDVFRAQPA